MKNKKIVNIFVFCVLLSSCSSDDQHKLLVTNNSTTCISEFKETCIEIINNKCNHSFNILREDHYEYYFKPDKYIISFICTNK